MKKALKNVFKSELHIKATALSLSTLILFGFASCKNNSEDSSKTESSISYDSSASVSSGSDEGYENAEKIVFSEDNVSADSENILCKGAAVTIQQNGEYIISGTCKNGSITVEKGLENVTLILNGVSLENTSTAPVTIKSSSYVMIELAKESENILSDNSSANDENAVIKVKSSAAAEFSGEGALYINGEFKNGISGADGASIIFSGGNISVDAANNAVTCDNEIKLCGASLSVNSGNDGIKAEPDEGNESSTGNISITGGAVQINAVGDGISAYGNLDISGGDINIKTTGEISVSENDDFGKFGNLTATTTNSSDDASSKGIKAGGNFSVTDGNITVDSTDHALHSTGELSISGGTLNLTSEKAKGISAHGNLTIDGESTQILIHNCTEGIESKLSITINNGTVRVLAASDDGINTGGNVSGDTSSHRITVNGGYLFVKAEGDGLDSNGDIALNGGTVIVEGPSNGGNSPLDSQYGTVFSGGEVIAVGYSGAMWQQDVFANISGDYIYTLNLGAADSVAITDGNDKLLCYLEPSLSVSLGIVYMNAEVSDINSCKILANAGFSGTLNEDSFANEGTLTGGNEVSANDGSAAVGGNIPGGFGNNIPGGGNMPGRF